MPDPRGRALGNFGLGSGLTARNIGDSVGTETVLLGTNNLPAHTHAWSNRYQGIGTGGSGSNALVTSSSAFDGTATVTPASVGSGNPVANMQPTLFAGTLFICYSGL